MVSLAKIKEMSWLSGKRAGLLFGLLIVALVVGAIVSVQGAMNLAQAGRWVAHTLEVMQDVQKTYVALSEAQAAQRSYVIIGDESFLRAFRESVEAVHSQLHRLRAMTADNPRELENLNRLEQLVEDRIRIMNQTILVFREQGFDAAKEEISTQRGLRAMQVVDSAIDSMILQERRLLDERTKASDRAAGWLIGAIAAGMFVTVALLGCVYWLVRRDAEQRAQAAEIMRRSEERFRAFMDNSPTVAFMKDAQGRLVYMNAPFAQAFRLDPATAIGNTDANLWPPETARQLRANDQRVWEAGTTLEFSESVPLPSGQIRDWSVYKFLIPDEAGQVLLGGVAIDITERVRAEAALRQIAARLKRSNRELQDFAYISSHDLQEPLRKIQAFGDRLKNQFSEALTEQGRDYVERMQRAAARMRTLIEDLLKFARVTTKAQPFTRIDLNVVVREVLDDLEVTIDRSGGHVTVGELPAIDADPLQMRQLFQNLLGNALKFCRPNEPPAINIQASLLEGGSGAHDERQCQITVEDNGIGFEDKYAERIFEVFQRLHERDLYEGSGIGLAICRKIVECHNGRMVARGQLGVGATFEITLPVHQAEHNAESEEALCQHVEEAFSY